MTRRSRWAPLLAVALAACAHLPFAHRARRPAFDDVLAQALVMTAAGQFDHADRALADYQRAHSSDSTAADAWYWRAVFNLEPSNQSASIDTAIVQLATYLAQPRPLRHLDEAMALRSAAADAAELQRVQLALRQARADARASNADQSATDNRDEEATRQIQRLRDELAAANAELERIKKRLANPKP